MREQEERKNAQRMEHLVKANAVRHARKDYRERVQRLPVDRAVRKAIRVIADPPDLLRTMPVSKALLPIPRVGKASFGALLKGEGRTEVAIPPLKALQDLTARQSQRVIAALKAWRSEGTHSPRQDSPAVADRSQQESSQLAA